jgi:hypothetical protein
MAENNALSTFPPEITTAILRAARALFFTAAATPNAPALVLWAHSKILRMAAATSSSVT